MAELKERTIEKEFVPYDLALELRNLGFEEPCFAFYGLSRDDYKTIRLSIFQNLKTDYLPDVHHLDVTCDAPLYQQAFRFFRAKYNFVSEINVYSTSDGYSFSFKILCKKYTPYIEANNAWIFHEEAEVECLVKLIEIAKEQNVK